MELTLNGHTVFNQLGEYYFLAHYGPSVGFEKCAKDKLYEKCEQCVLTTAVLPGLFLELVKAGLNCLLAAAVWLAKAS